MAQPEVRFHKNDLKNIGGFVLRRMSVNDANHDISVKHTDDGMIFRTTYWRNFTAFASRLERDAQQELTGGKNKGARRRLRNITAHLREQVEAHSDTPSS